MHDRTNRRNQNTFFQYFTIISFVDFERCAKLPIIDCFWKSFFFSPLCFVIRFSWYCSFFSLSLSSSLAIAATSTALFVFDFKKSMNFYLFIILPDSKSMFGWFGLAPLLSRLTTSNSHPFVYNIWPRCVYTMTVAIIECALILIFPPCQFFFFVCIFFYSFAILSLFSPSENIAVALLIIQFDTIRSV